MGKTYVFRITVKVFLKIIIMLRHFSLSAVGKIFQQFPCSGHRYCLAAADPDGSFQLLSTRTWHNGGAARLWIRLRARELVFCAQDPGFDLQHQAASRHPISL